MLLHYVYSSFPWEYKLKAYDKHYLLLAGPYLPTKLLHTGLFEKEGLFLLRKKYQIPLLVKQESNTVS